MADQSRMGPIHKLAHAGIIEGAAHGKGRGREVIAVARSADLVLMVLDGGKEQVNNHRTILERCVGLLVVCVCVCGGGGDGSRRGWMYRIKC